MDYKVFVNIYVPAIEQNFEMFLPINKTISQDLVLINKLINSVTNGVYPIRDNIVLYNRKTSQIYDYNQVVRNTDIQNGTELVIE